MSQIRVDTLTDEAGTGSPSFPNGVAAAELTGSIDAARLTSVPAANLTGDVAAASITTALNASGSAPIYACRAWVNFDGTGTVAIRASGNVSSITDNGTGNYTVNFTTAMPDANFAAVATGQDDTEGGSGNQSMTTQAFTASSVRVRQDGSTVLQDPLFVSVAIFR
jgi:hypothetical protein